MEGQVWKDGEKNKGVRKMTFGKVIDIILKYHAEALLDPVIKKPYAWSLFQAWKWVDKHEKPREEAADGKEKA